MPPCVLVADDAIGFRLALKSAFEVNGAGKVIECERWSEVPEAAAAVRPDAILADLMMPTLDLDALRATRAAAPDATLAVISSYPREDTLRELGDVGGIDLVFSKRERPDDIARTMLASCVSG